MEEDFERALDERDLLLILQVWLEVLGHRMEQKRDGIWQYDVNRLVFW